MTESEDDRVRVLRKLKEIITASEDDVLAGVYLNKVYELTGVRLKLQRPVSRKGKSNNTLSHELKMVIAAMEFNDLREYVKNEIDIELFKDPEARDIVASLKKGIEFDEIIATMSEEKRKRYIEFISTLDFEGSAREALKKDIEKKLKMFLRERKMKKPSLEEIIKLKKEEMGNHERLDNTE